MPRAFRATILSSKPVGDQQRLEAAVPAARHLDANRAVFGQNGLGAGAVARVRDGGRLGSARRIAQVMVHLATQRPLDQGLLESQCRGIDAFGRHRAVTELFKQLGGNRQQFYRLGFWFAGINTPWENIMPQPRNF